MRRFRTLAVTKPSRCSQPVEQAPLLLRLHSYLGQILLCGLRLASIENFQHRQKCLDSAHGKRFDPQLDVIDAFLRVGS